MTPYVAAATTVVNLEAELADSLVGLRVWLPRACQCGSIFAVIEGGHGPDRAGLRCACHRHRGWISGETLPFLRNVVGLFGQPTVPIEIRVPVSRIAAPKATQNLKMKQKENGNE